MLSCMLMLPIDIRGRKVSSSTNIVKLISVSAFGICTKQGREVTLIDKMFEDHR